MFPVAVPSQAPLQVTLVIEIVNVAAWRLSNCNSARRKLHPNASVTV